MDDKLLIDWMKEVNKEFQLTRDQMVEQHKELQKEIAINREEFVIFKTRVNTRTALISATAGFVAVILSIIMNFGSIKERQNAKHIEPKTDAIEQPIE
jgi:hypothetical protein